MKTMKIIGIATFFIIMMQASCKKEKNDSGVAPEDCVVRRSTPGSNIIAGRYIVAYNNAQVNRKASDAALSRISTDVLARNEISPASIKDVFAGEPGGFIAALSEEEAARLATDPSIQVVEPDRVIALGSCFTVVEPKLITWNVNRVGYGNGIGKTAWIIDSGIDIDHPDLTVDVTRSKSFITGQTSADDAHGHGTHVAGIIGAKNNTFGVLGVASGATLVSLRVLDGDGEGTLSSIIQALAYINTNAAAGDVVNMSLGEDHTSTTLNQQIQNTSSRGIYITIAAGNDSESANKYSPGNANGLNIFTVSAIDSLDQFASFSNYGNDVVDYAAPGVRILSTFSNGRYAYLSGTSMAAPHLAGLILLKGKNFTVSGVAQNDPDGTPDPIAHY